MPRRLRGGARAAAVERAAARRARLAAAQLDFDRARRIGARCRPAVQRAAGAIGQLAGEIGATCTRRRGPRSIGAAPLRRRGRRRCCEPSGRPGRSDGVAGARVSSSAGRTSVKASSTFQRSPFQPPRPTMRRRCARRVPSSAEMSAVRARADRLGRARRSSARLCSGSRPSFQRPGAPLLSSAVSTPGWSVPRVGRPRCAAEAVAGRAGGRPTGRATCRASRSPSGHASNGRTVARASSACAGRSATAVARTVACTGAAPAGRSRWQSRSSPSPSASPRVRLELERRFGRDLSGGADAHPAPRQRRPCRTDGPIRVRRRDGARPAGRAPATRRRRRSGARRRSAPRLRSRPGCADRPAGLGGPDGAPARLAASTCPARGRSMRSAGSSRCARARPATAPARCVDAQRAGAGNLQLDPDALNSPSSAPFGP